MKSKKMALISSTLASALFYGAIAQSENVSNGPSEKRTKVYATRELPIQINFDGSNSYDPDGKIVRCTWDFGDGKKYTESINNAPDGKFDCKTEHYYFKSGKYKIISSVKDKSGATKIDTLDLLILLIQFKKESDEKEVNGV